MAKSRDEGAVSNALTGKVQTVLGLIEPGALGTTITHEHLLVDETELYCEPDDPARKATFHAPLTMPVLNRIHYAGHDNLESVRMSDEQVATEEALLFKQAGGDTIAEVSSIGLGRDPLGLARIARATQLNIIMGSSYYVDETHPDDMDTKSEAAITAEIVAEFSSGAEGTDVRPGIIGEVGCSWPLTENERKVCRASARAQALTGAPLMIHPGRHPSAPQEIVEILTAAGADLTRTIMCHIDRTIFDQDTLRRLADSGCVIEYDLFGHEHALYTPNPEVDQPNDAKRLDWIRFLIDEGFGAQIVVSHDIDNKIYLSRYGGPGYAHIVENVVPLMRRRGFDEGEIQMILVGTPRRLFTFVRPQDC